MSIASNLIVAFAALLIEAAIGYPAGLYRALRHPVVWMGLLLDRLERRFNLESMPERARRLNGAIALLILLAATMLPAFALQYWLMLLLPSFVASLILALLASMLIAQRSLWSHVGAVAEALERRGIEHGRDAVAKIVGRDVQDLDSAGVARAAIESLAENFSDGVVAPAFWCGLLGLPGVAGYKAVNTADSMIGHLTPRYSAFGFAAAKLDDLLNLPASRLAALWLILAASLQPAASAAGAWRIACRDARHHRSPNAGWPEAALAGALGLKLGGPRIYAGSKMEVHWIGEGRSELTSADIRRAMSLYRIACAVQIAAYGLAALVIAQA